MMGELSGKFMCRLAIFDVVRSQLRGELVKFVSLG